MRSPNPLPATLQPTMGKGPHTPMFQVFGQRPFSTDGDLLALEFAPDGTIWSVEEPGLLRHWQPATGELLDWQLLSELETLWAFSPDATLLASGSDELTLWDGSGQVLAFLESPSWATALAFSPDSSLLASGHDDGVVRIWNTSSQRMIRELQGHDRPISALAFSADGGQLASACEGRIIRLWQVEKSEMVGTLIGHTDRIPALAWHPLGHRLYSAGWDTTARVWDVATGAPIILLNSHSPQVTALALRPDGRLLACADSTSTIHIWDLETHRTLNLLARHTGEVRCLAFSASGQQLASGGSDRMIHLWTDPDQRDPMSDQSASVVTARPVITSKIFPSSVLPTGGPEHEVRSGVALSPDGTHLVLIDGKNGLRLWDTATVRTVREDRETGPLFALAYSANGQWIAGGGDRVLYLWDAGTGQRRAWADGQPLPTTALAFTPDGKILASASAASLDVWLWDSSSGQPLLLIPEAVDTCSVEALAFHPEGRLLAVGGIDWLATSGSDGVVMLWDVVTRGPAVGWTGGVRSLVFHPSGQHLACATLNRTIKIYDALAERVVFELTGHEDMAHSVAYSPDGSWLASGGADRTVRLWDADTGRMLARTELDTQVKSLLFSADCRYLFTSNANTSCYQLDVQQLLEEGV